MFAKTSSQWPICQTKSKLDFLFVFWISWIYNYSLSLSIIFCRASRLASIQHGSFHHNHASINSDDGTITPVANPPLPPPPLTSNSNNNNNLTNPASSAASNAAHALASSASSTGVYFELTHNNSSNTSLCKHVKHNNRSIPNDLAYFNRSISIESAKKGINENLFWFSSLQHIFALYPKFLARSPLYLPKENTATQ